MTEKKRVLILCTGNSARSQMAEGLLRRIAGERFDVRSAGTIASFVRICLESGSQLIWKGLKFCRFHNVFEELPPSPTVSRQYKRRLEFNVQIGPVYDLAIFSQAPTLLSLSTTTML